MPHNFKLTGDYYVSKDGSDANDGLTPDTPFKTINRLYTVAGTMAGMRFIIGAGVYQEGYEGPAGGNNTFTIGDGEVILRGNGSNAFRVTPVGGQVTYFENLTIDNYLTIGLFTSGTPVYRNCRIINCPNFDINSKAGDPTFDLSLVLNCSNFGSFSSASYGFNFNGSLWFLTS